MTTRRLIFCAALLASGPSAAQGLAPHRAVYDLSMASQSGDLTGIEARIAFDLRAPDCDAYDLDYRFVSRFVGTGETTLTDQRITAQETRDGSRYGFQAVSSVDGTEQSRAEGVAETEGQETRVELQQPVERTFTLPMSQFPLAHTQRLIERARAGERLVETRLYDGDIEGENLLTTTAVIAPVPADAEARPELADLSAWRIDESYFTLDGADDGLPTFHTRYTLYENGVTDALYLDFGAYVLEGGLRTLALSEDAPTCP